MKIMIDGVPVEVVSDEEANLAAFVVCVRADSPAAEVFDDRRVLALRRCHRLSYPAAHGRTSLAAPN